MSEVIFDAPSASRESRHALLLGHVCTETAEVLGVSSDTIDPNASLLSYGFDSLMGIELWGRLETVLGLRLPDTPFFSYPSLHALADHLDEVVGDVRPITRVPSRSVSAKPAPAPVGSDRSHPLAGSQRDVWLANSYRPHNPRLNILGVHLLGGPLDVSALAGAIGRLTSRQEALRTTVVRAAGGEPRQLVLPAAPGLAIVDCTGVPAERWASEIQRRGREELWTGIDIERDSLFTSTLLRFSETAHVLLRRSHRFIADGWSLRLIDMETALHYNSLVGAETPASLDERLSFAETALSNAEQDAGTRAQHVGFWTERLSGASPLILALADRPTRPLEPGVGMHLLRVLADPLLRRLQAFAQKHQTTLFATFLTAYELALAHLAHVTDVVVVSPSANRRSPASRRVIGPFAKLMVLRTAFSGRPSFVEALHRTRDVVTEGCKHQSVSPGEVLHAMFDDRFHERRLTDVLFSFVSLPLPRLPMHGLHLETIRIERAPAKVDLGLWIWERNGAYECDFEYNASAFDAHTIEALANAFELTVMAALEDGSDG